MLASKYADAPPSSPKGSEQRASPPADAKPLPPLPGSPNGAAPEQAHSRAASRDQMIANGSPKAPRFSRSPQKSSTSAVNDEDTTALPSSEQNGKDTRPSQADVVPVTSDGAPAVQRPAQPEAGAQSRDTLPMPEPSRPQPLAAPAKIPAKKITSKKGRPCIIRIPAETFAASVRVKPMSLAEITARVKRFESDGYNVKGFDHDNGPGKQPDDGLDVRSRFLFHASQTSQSLPLDAKPGRPTVTIPDKKSWEKYRNDLVEAKLKALGVIPADPEPAPEPEDMDMSMQDQQMYPGMATSPPPLSSSVNSQHHWQGPTPFSAGLSEAGFTNGTSIGGIGSPVSSLGGPQMQRPGHLSRASTFNFNFPAAFNPALAQQFSPQPGQGGPLGFHRGGSPSLAGNAIPRIPSALSRASPDPFAEQRQQTPRLPNSGLQHNTNFQMPIQPQPPMQPPAKNPRRMTLMNQTQLSQPGSAEMTPQGSNQGFDGNARDFVSTPPTENGASYADLAYPTPRGHRSNLSQNLEREAEKPQYYPGEYVENEREEPEPQPQFSKDSSATTSHVNKPSHTSTGSTSKFNVAAKEFKFDPRAAHHRQMSSTKNPFMPEQAPSISSKPTVSFITAHANGETTGGGNFDARASSFKPPSQGDFSFGSTPFDFSKTAEPKVEAAAVAQAEADDKEDNGKGEKKSKIFGGINFADFVKPTRKSKAIPIVNPNAVPKKEPTPVPQETIEDNDGRVAQDVSRHKRGRTAAPGGNDIPRFATPSSPGLTPQPESVKAKSPAPEIQAAQEIKPEEKQEASIPEETKSDQKVDEDETAHWSDFGIDAPKTPPQRVEPKPKPLVELKQNHDSMDTTVPRSVVSDATSAAAQASTWQSLLDSSPPRLPSPSRLPHFPGRGFDPDFHEIDAIMEQLNEQPHHGAEEEARAPSPAKSSIVNERLGGPSPELREPEPEPEPETEPQPQPSIVSKHAPEPERQSRLTAPSFGHETARSRSRDVSITPADWVKDQRMMRNSASPVRKLNTAKEPEVSDWDEMLSDKEAAKFLPKAQFFDTRVKSIFEGILQQHLGPVQKSLKDMDKVVKSMPGREPREAWPLTDRADKTESDADDEDNADETDAQRSRALRSDKKLDKIRSIVQEAVASQQSSDSSTKRELDSLRSALLEAISSARPAAAPAVHQLDIKDIRSAVAEIVNSKPEPQLNLDDIRFIVHDVVSAKSVTPPAPHLDASEIRNLVQEVVNAKSASPTSPTPAPLDSQEIRAIVQEVVGAKQDSTMRLEDEMRLRNDAERKAHDLQRLLTLSEKELTLYKESSENTEQQIKGFRNDRSEAQDKITALEKIERDLRARTSGLTTEVSNLQGTLEEYRTSSQRWRTEIDTVKKARESLQHTIEDLRSELHGTKQSRDTLGAKIEKLQTALSTATGNLQKERENFRARDEQLAKESAVLGSRLEEEFRTRQRLERELDRQGVHERNAVKATVTLEELRNTNQRLMAENAKLRQENANERNSAQLHEREAVEAKDIARSEIQRNKTLLDAEVEVANMRTESTRTDLETRLEHVRGELSAARYENAKIRQDNKKTLEDAHSQRIQAVREASESANHAREEERKHFERLTAELSKQHDEAMKRALDERQHAEVHFTETHKLSQEKTSLLEDKVRHLEDKVHVAQSAAKAAADAAQQQNAAKAKEAAAQREHLRPSERVSPQALRESIVVLQEQLQQRESRIESLESELDAVDKELPGKYKERETEVSWLRELFNVRLDDISELVNLLSLDNYDRVAARDAAIRIQANLQMEQQEKERLIGRSNGGRSLSRGSANNPLPSLNDIQNFATPRAAQLAAAWGNWRKTGQSPSLASLRNAVSGQPTSENGTPSRPKPPSLGRLPSANVADNANAASNFLSGLMTPPATNLRRTPTPQRASSREREDEEMSNMSDAQPLSLAAELGDDGDSVIEGSPSKMMAGGRSGRPNTPPAQGGRHEEDPASPSPAGKGSYDLGAEMQRAGDADDDEGEDEDEAENTEADDVAADIAQDAKLAPLET